jgi:signal transduction histidine kinase
MTVAGAGLCAAAQAVAEAPVGLRLADALTGAVFVAVAVKAVGDERLRSWGVLVFAAGAVWFAGSLVAELVFGWRVAIALAILTFPTGRLVRGPAARWSWLAFVLAGAVAVPALGTHGPLVALAAAAVAFAATTQPEPLASVRATRVGAASALAAAMMWPSLAGWWWEAPDVAGPAAAYGNCLLLSAAGVVLGWGAVAGLARRTHDVLDELVVELDGRDPVLRALDDPSGLSPGDLAPRQAALDLLAENRRLQAALEMQIAAVDESQRRLLETAQVERRRLAARLDHEVGPLLDRIDEALSKACRGAGDDVARAMVTSARDEVAGCRRDLAELAGGLHPARLRRDGLTAAIADLARRSSVPVELVTPASRYGEAQEAAVWFVCAEALSNIGKHARATRVLVSVVEERDAWLRVVVEDDGAGGGALIPGGGLAGLRDRLRALGGDLRVGSSPSGGTRLEGRLPCPS